MYSLTAKSFAVSGLFFKKVYLITAGSAVFADRLAGTRTCAFINNESKEIKMDEMAEILSQISPNAVRYWSDRIAQIDRERLNTILNRFPIDWVNPERVEFAEVFIDYNARRLQEIIERSQMLFIGNNN
jgi:hypothetical protein